MTHRALPLQVRVCEEGGGLTRCLPRLLRLSRNAAVHCRCAMCAPTGVCEKSTPPEKRTRRKISFKHTKSGALSQFMLQVCRATAGIKGVFCSQTPVSYVCDMLRRSVPCRATPPTHWHVVPLIGWSQRHVNSLHLKCSLEKTKSPRDSSEMQTTQLKTNVSCEIMKTGLFK